MKVQVEKHNGHKSNNRQGYRPERGRGRGFGSPNAQGQQQPNQSFSGSSIEYSDSDKSIDQSQFDESYTHNHSRHQFKSPRQYNNEQKPYLHPTAQSTPNRSQYNQCGQNTPRGAGANRDRSRSVGRRQNMNGNQHFQQGRDRSSSGERSNQSGYGSLNDSFSPYRNRWGEDPTVFLSKTLSSILRHNAANFNLKLMKGGFIYVREIFQKVRKLQGFTVEDVIDVVRNNDKQRFTLEEDQYGLKIRANQGHTMEVEDLDLKPITSADDYPRVIHGTYYEAWESIKRTGLNRMKRNHIHFAPGEPGANGVISGMRSSCEVMIILDLEKALKDGLKFFISSNNVILSPGDAGGLILPKYFLGALDRRYNYRLDFDQNVTAIPGADSKAQESRGKGKNKGKKNKKTDRQNNVNSSESSANNSLEPPSKKKILSTSNEEPSGSSYVGITVKTAETVAETTTKAADTEAMAKISESYGHVSEDSDEDSEEEELETNALDDIETIVDVDDLEISQTVISDIMSTETPFIVIICRGDRLGQEKGHIRQLAVGANTSLYIFNLQSKCMMEDGRLKELLLDKTIPKVFSRVEEISVSLINEYDILMNGVPIWDLEILYEKLPSQMKAKDKEALKKLNIEEGMFEKWSKTNCKSEERQEDLVQQAIMMYRMFEILHKSLDSQASHVKTIKSETYKKAIPSDGDHFLSEKIRRLRLVEKENKKKGKGQQAESASAGDKGEETRGSGGKNKKKKRRH